MVREDGKKLIRVEKELRFEEKRLKASLRINDLAKTEEEAINLSLEEAVKLTDSEVGYLHFVEDNQTRIRLKSWSQEVLKKCPSKTGMDYPLKEAGIWADCLRFKRPVIHNDYPNEQKKKGYPKWHFPVKRHMSVPIFDRGKVVAIIGVGNKKEPYTDFDSKQLSLLISRTWSILERLGAEEELRQSEEKYRNLFDNSHDLIQSVLPDGSFNYVNNFWFKKLGYTKKDLEKIKVWDIIHPDHLKHCQKIFKQLMKGRPARDIKVDFVTKKGTVISVMGDISLVHLNGGIKATNGFFHDVTEERKSQEKLKESEEKYHNLVESANDAIVFINTKGTVVEVNKKLTEISGYKYQEIVGKKLSILRSMLPKESMVTVLNNFAKRLAGKKINTYSIKIRIKTGELRDFEVSAKIVKKEGKIIGDLAILRDVTERKELLREVRRRKQELEAVIENIVSGVLVINTKKEILLFNKEAARISGYTEKEVIGKKVKDIFVLVKEGTDKSNCLFIDNCLRTGQRERMKNHSELITKDGARVSIWTSASALKDQDNKITGCVVVFRDISREREIDRMKSEFVSVASHQLRTPLSGTKWLAELLLRGKAGKLTLKQEEYVRDIYSSNNRLIKLVGDLLDVSRIETGRKFNIVKRKASTCRIINEVIRGKRQIIKEKKIKLIRKYTEGEKCLMVSVDSQKIKQVFANLVDNAIKFTSDKGKMEIGCKSNKKEVVFYFKDNGVGIPRRQQHQVFEKFFRADNVSTLDVGGTGLGLYIAKAIVEAHEGKIWFESKENKGTVFYVSLPLNNKVNRK